MIARTYCVNCHAIDKLSPSPLTIAPPFRDLHKKYPVEQLQEALAEGVVTGHPTMPEFRFAAGSDYGFHRLPEDASVAKRRQEQVAGFQIGSTDTTRYVCIVSASRIDTYSPISKCSSWK